MFFLLQVRNNDTFWQFPGKYLTYCHGKINDTKTFNGIIAYKTDNLFHFNRDGKNVTVKMNWVTMPALGGSFTFLNSEEEKKMCNDQKKT